MTKPSKKVIADHCTRAGATEKQAKQWARFLHGLDWDTIKPLTTMALNTSVHPAIAAGMVISTTRDDNTRALLQGHLEARAATLGNQDTGTPPTPTV
jgi:hypothetical protein